jgi:hypothetical protein
MTVSLQLADASTDPRPVRECKRCSYIWRQAEVQGAPIWCPRCGSAAWDRVPRTVRARRPSDPPNPRWKQRKRQSPPPYDYDRMERGSDAREPQADPRVPAGIPRNYILEPYVPKGGGAGLPPPPSLRTHAELPPPPRTQVVSAPMPAPSFDEMDREVKSQNENAWQAVIDMLHEFPEPDLEYALAAAQGESE